MRMDATLCGYERSFGRAFLAYFAFLGVFVLLFLCVFMYQLVALSDSHFAIFIRHRTPTFGKNASYMRSGKLLRQKVIMHVHGRSFELLFLPEPFA
jgi:hypothetical protein